LGWATSDQIDQALDFNSAVEHVSDSPAVGDLDAIVKSHPHYEQFGALLELRRLLQCVAAWNPHLGFEPSFACFCAKAITEFEREEDAFYVITTVYQAFKLDQYYSPKPGEDGTEYDAQFVLETVAQFWPEFEAICAKPEKELLLKGLIKGWLRSLFSLAFDGVPGEPSDYGPMLKCIVARVTPQHGKLSRGVLRDMAIAILGAHYKTIVAADANGALRALVDRLQCNIQVDASLIALIDKPLCAESCSSFYTWSWVPALTTIGFAMGHQITLTFGCPCAAMGVILGGLTAAYVGNAEGSGYTQVAVHETVNASDTKEASFPPQQPPEPRSVAKVGSSSQSPAAFAASPSTGRTGAPKSQGSSAKSSGGEILHAAKWQAPVPPGPLNRAVTPIKMAPKARSGGRGQGY
jgi:hypothetical protein